MTDRPTIPASQMPAAVSVPVNDLNVYVLVAIGACPALKSSPVPQF